ncbi:MAG: FHA domain-containing protein, partial [Ktedonobacterales bacterium]
ITDLRSSNGTFLNGRQLTSPALLSPGDVLRIGEFVLRCQRATDAPTSSPHTPDTEAANNTSDATTPPSSSSTTQALNRQSVQATIE